MRVGTIIRLCFAAVFSIFGLLCLSAARQQGRRNHRHREAILLQMPVDLSVDSAQYQGTLHSIWDHPPHGAIFGIETPNGFPCRESARRAFRGADIAVNWYGSKGENIFAYVLDDRSVSAFAPNGHRFYPASPEDRTVRKKDDYTLTLKIIKPALALKGVPQTLVVRYAWCGVEDMAVIFLLVFAFILGLVAAPLGVPVIWRFLRSQRQAAAQ
jgi:hypothetical protein